MKRISVERYSIQRFRIIYKLSITFLNQINDSIQMFYEKIAGTDPFQSVLQKNLAIISLQIYELV